MPSVETLSSMSESAPGEGRAGAFSRLTRRRAFKLLLAAPGGLLAVGGAGALWLHGCPPDVPGLGVLGDREARTLEALGEVMFPPLAAFDPGLAPGDLARAFDGFLRDEPAANVSGLTRALLLLEAGPLLYDHGVTPFSRLDVDARRVHFESWVTSDELLRRVVATAFRRFLSLVVYDRPQVWAYLGYRGTLRLPTPGGGGVP